MSNYFNNVWSRFVYLFPLLLKLQTIKTLPVEIGHGAIFGLAVLYRLALRRVIFIGVTGSTGKTTTKELIAAILSSRLKGQKNLGVSYSSGNLPFGVANTILRVRPQDKFCVQEIAAAIGGKKIALEKSVGLLKPQIGVVTNIGSDHFSVFRTLEATADEKGKLIAVLPQSGTAVLNADDPNVLSMEKRCKGKVVTYGLGPDTTLRAVNIQCTWPERLSFTLIYNGQSYAVQTQFLGTHWVPCFLAAFAVGLTLGVPLATAVQTVQTVGPIKGRMYPLSYQNGITVIWDDVKAPLWSIPPALKIMKEARAKRKVVIIGTISDYPGNANRKYLSVARQALDAANHVIFIGRQASRCLKARRSPHDDTLQAFYSVEAAGEYLNNLFNSGDLVLIKGSESDGLAKIKLAQTKGQDPLPIPHALDKSSYRSIQSSHPTTPGSIGAHFAEANHQVRALVGLGNQGLEYQNTPHNVGKRVLDLLSKSLNGEWTREDQAMVARVVYKGNPIYLIDPLTYVNATGPVLLQLSQHFGISTSEFLVVHDDVDLPLGRVRSRTKGSDGGHKGLRSIFKAFDTEAFLRVKIGVGRPREKDKLATYVLEEFSPTDIPALEDACIKAMQKVLEIIASSHQTSNDNG